MKVDISEGLLKIMSVPLDFEHRKDLRKLFETMTANEIHDNWSRVVIGFQFMVLEGYVKKGDKLPPIKYLIHCGGDTYRLSDYKVDGFDKDFDLTIAMLKEK